MWRNGYQRVRAWLAASISDHWQGRVSIRRAVWLHLVGVNLLLVTGSRLFYLPEWYGYDTRVQIRVLVALFPLAVVVSIWQLVGLWRVAGRDPLAARFRSVLRSLVVAAGAGLMGVGVITSAAALDVAGSAAGFDNMAQYRLEVLGGGVLSVEGDIGFGLSADVRDTLEAHPHLSRVRLNSIGGRGSEGVLLARVIERAGLDTEVTRGCFSACTFAFLGGHQRTLASSALLGFHWKRPGSFLTDLELGYHLRRLFSRAGVDPVFSEQTFQVPIDDLWIPSHAELRAAGVTTTEWVAGAQKTMHGHGPMPYPRPGA